MHFKSLVLGSAAAFVAVTSARAADAVVAAEPEPMEYVRICDAYGVGFYYIPGTETCLKISGYLRTDVGVGAFGLTNVVDKKDDAEENPFPWEREDILNDAYDMRARFQLRADARAETELGTLRGYAAINFDWDTFTTSDYTRFRYDNGFTTTGDDWSVEHIYIELAGLRVGVTDSLFTTFTGFAGGVINDDIIDYGPGKTHQIAFGWANDSGFGFTVAIEEGGGDKVAPFLPGDTDTPDLYALDSYLPHVVGGVGWQNAWGGLSAVAGYDAVWEQGAIKGRVDFYPTDRLALFVMAGWSSYEEDYFFLEYFDNGWTEAEVKDSPNYYAPWGGNWAVWGGGSFMLTDKATLNVQASYDEMEDFALVANVAYELVPNFVITPEIAYIDNFNDKLNDWYEWETDKDLINENWGFFVRAQMNFGG